MLLINAPICVLAIVLGWTSMHESRDKIVPRHIDWLVLVLDDVRRRCAGSRCDRRRADASAQR